VNELFSKTIVELKNEFTRNNKGGSHIQEVIPISSSEKLPIDKPSVGITTINNEGKSIKYAKCSNLNSKFLKSNDIPIAIMTNAKIELFIIYYLFYA